jgi:hypothetical protein
MKMLPRIASWEMLGWEDFSSGEPASTRRSGGIQVAM